MTTKREKEHATTARQPIPGVTSGQSMDVTQSVERVRVLCEQAKSAAVNLAVCIAKAKCDSPQWAVLKDEIAEITNKVMTLSRELQELLDALASANPTASDSRQIEKEMNVSVAMRLEKELYAVMNRSESVTTEISRLIDGGSRIQISESSKAHNMGA